MTSLSRATGPGYFYVLSEPKSSEYVDEYNEWYETEHGPLRLTLDFVLNGYRYKSQGSGPPVYLATYDLQRVSGLSEPQYTALRDRRSDRESCIVNHKLKYLDRRIYSDISSRGTCRGPAPVVMSVAFVVKNEHVDELHRWYDEEHTADLAKIPGWRRTRRFQLVEGDGVGDGYTELLAVHDFDHVNGLDGPEHEYAKSRPWRNKVLELVESRDHRRFDFLHVFRAGDYRPPPAFHEPHVQGVHGSKASLAGATSWRLDGPDTGPVIAFSNSLLTDSHIWDGVVDALQTLYPHHRYLRYNTRGYEGPSEDRIDIDLLTDDLAFLLDHLGIERCFAVVGVSLGGITTLNFAIRYPSRLDRFVACDCNVASSEQNTHAWQERVALAHSEGGWETLADRTVERWFTPASVSAQTPGYLGVRQMIVAGSKTGFANCVGALCDYDLNEKISSIDVPGLCLVGAQDGRLPQAMSASSHRIPQATFAAIPDAGHLPMVENPSAFVLEMRPLFELQLTNHSDS